MWSRYFGSKSTNKAKKNKDKVLSLTVKDSNGCEEYTVKVSKHLLTECSLFFQKKESNGEFKKCRKIMLEGLTKLSLKKIVEYMENSMTIFNSYQEDLEILKAAHVCQIQGLKNICTDHIITVLEPNNVCEIYESISHLSLSDLEYRCLRLIDQYADDIFKTQGFLNLQKSIVLEITKRSSLNISSELIIFQAVLKWAQNECLRKNINAENIEGFMSVAKTVLMNVRFLTMIQEELLDPEVEKYYKLLFSDDSSSKRKSLLSNNRKSRSGTVESFQLLTRQFVTQYAINLDVFEADQQPVKDGEVFSLRLEILKGNIFITSLSLAFVAFAATKNAACLSLVATATNILTLEQKHVRGTFLNTSDVVSLEFSSPLAAKESERIDIALNVKRAENVCPLVIRNEAQIAVSECKEAALKVTPPASEKEEKRCIFKDIFYFI